MANGADVAEPPELPSSLSKRRFIQAAIAAGAALSSSGCTGFFQNSGSRTQPGQVRAVSPDVEAVFDDVRFGAVRGMTYGMYEKPGAFIPQLRALGARTVRVYFYWSQIEPEPDRFVWDDVDAFLEQLHDDDEAWITICSSSQWATQRKTRTLSPSPAKDVEQYRSFVAKLVAHCQGRIRFWQCDNEPSVPLLWAGTASEYLVHLNAFWRAVKQSDPNALVVLGGAPPETFAAEGGIGDQQAVAFFDRLLKEGRDSFDVFDVHLYTDPYIIPATIDACRQRMTSFGYSKPVVVGEYNGPLPFMFPEVFPHLQPLLAALSEQVSGQTNMGLNDNEPFGPDEPVMLDLYKRMATLPPALQMFMTDCPPELEAKRHRLNCRDLVMRNMLALANGVRRTLCWQLAPDTQRRMGSRYHVMQLMFSKFMLLDYEGETLSRRYPSADTLRLLTRQLDGVQEVRRIQVPERPQLYLFEVSRQQRPRLIVVWERRDGFDSEDEPAVPFTWDWNSRVVSAVDVFGASVPVHVSDGRLHVGISVTPIFIEAPGEHV